MLRFPRFAAVSLVVVFILGINCLVIDATLSPILVITGYGGSQLHVQDETNTNCNTGGKSIRVWINITHTTDASQCFISQMTLNYTNDGQYLDAQDVTVSTVNFGSLSSFAGYSDILPPSDSDDAESIIDYFVDRGYSIDKNLRAAPYDWRLGAVQLDARGYYSNLRQLIEGMYRNNSNTKVTLVVFSMGGPVSHYFLTQVVSQGWKDTYIHSYISLGAAWSGTSYTSLILTPPPMSTFFFFIPVRASTRDLLSMTQSFASSYWLLPRASVYGDTILVSTPSQNYTASDYQQLFNDAGFPEGYVRASENSNEFPAPNVPTYCFYGLGFPTALRYVYDDGFPNTQPSVVYGDGDDTVNKESLEVCNQWANSGYPFNRTIFPRVNHFDIINHRAVVQAIGQIVGAPADPINGVKPLAMLQYLYAIVFISLIYIVMIL